MTPHPLQHHFDVLNNLYGSPQTLAAIWITKPLQTSMAKTVRLCKGQKVRVEQGELRDVTEALPATHIIERCRGTLLNKFEIDLKELGNDNYLTIKI
jgi:hypothetical protein